MKQIDEGYSSADELGCQMSNGATWSRFRAWNRASVLLPCRDGRIADDLKCA